jgi:hypothetical protein
MPNEEIELQRMDAGASGPGAITKDISVLKVQQRSFLDIIMRKPVVSDGYLC